jgi:hypothetical protein
VWDEVVRQTGNEMGQREVKGSHSLGGLPGRLGVASRCRQISHYSRRLFGSAVHLHSPDARSAASGF